MHVKKKLISLVLALGMLGGTQTALAAEPAAQEAAPLPAWSYGMLADGYSLGLFGDEIYTQHSQTVTTEQLDAMTQVVADKLALLLGTEGDGLARTTIDGCDEAVCIPMSHDVDSLNVAAASAVAFWELRYRQPPLSNM